MRRRAGPGTAAIVVALMALGCGSSVPTPSPAPATGGPPSALPSPSPTPWPYPSLDLHYPTPEPQPTPPPSYPPDPAFWSPVGDLAEARTGHAAALLKDGRVLVSGGDRLVPLDDFDVDGITLDSVEIFDPATGSWSAGPPMHAARTDHFAVTLSDGRVFVVGGGFNPEGSNVGANVTSAEIFDPTTNAWTLVKEVPDRVSWDSATLLDDGRVFLIGWTARAFPREQKAAIFDPASRKWSSVPETELVRGGHRTLVLADGTVLVAGGFDPRGDETGALTDAAVYDPTANTWTNVGPMVTPAWNIPLAKVPDGQVLAMTEPNQRYDPSTRTWTSAPGPVGIEALVGLADHRVLAFPDASGQATALDLSVYDPRTGEWAASGRFIQITGMTVTTLLDGRVLSAGGYLGCYNDNPCASGEIANAWVFDPARAP